MVNLTRFDFLEKIGEYYPQNMELKHQIIYYPSLTFFVEKIKIINLVYPQFNKNDLIKFIIGQVDDKTEYYKYMKYSDDLKMLLQFAKQQDESYLNQLE